MVCCPHSIGNVHSRVTSPGKERFMESMKGPFEERNTAKKQRVATTKLLAALLLSSIILLVSCGSQSNTGSPGDPSSTPTASSPTSEALQTIHMIDAKTGWAMTQS